MLTCCWPTTRPVCYARPPQTINQEHVSVDNLFFQSVSLLHAMDNCSRWSKLGRSQTRRICDQIDTPVRIQLFLHGILKSVQADQKYDKSKFISFCYEYSMLFILVAASHHKRNVYIKQANMTIWSYSNKLVLSKAQSPLIRLVAAATTLKNTYSRHKKRSSLEVLYTPVPNLSILYNPSQYRSFQDNVAE